MDLRPTPEVKMPSRACLLLLSLVLAGPRAEGQQIGSLTNPPPSFESWRPTVPAARPTPLLIPTIRSDFTRRDRNALIGGAIGTVAGLAFCTVVSNMTTDPAAGFSTCTTKGYLVSGSIGLMLGLLIGSSL
jgi:hypothetical protein